MARRVHLHMDMAESEAMLIRDAAKLAKLRPSHYALNRLVRMAELEIAMRAEDQKPQGPPEDIDTGSTGTGGTGGGPSGGSGTDDDETALSPEKVKQRLIKRRAQKIAGGRVVPLI